MYTIVYDCDRYFVVEQIDTIDPKTGEYGLQTKTLEPYEGYASIKDAGDQLERILSS